MENLKNAQDSGKDIVYSKTIKAGKRIYYVDVKRNRKGDYYIALTESKKIISAGELAPAISFEKHKIFLYQEDFDKFTDALADTIRFIRNENNPSAADSSLDHSLK